MANSGHQGNVKHPEKDGRLKENREEGRTMGTTPGSRERQETGGHSSAEAKHSSGGGEHRASEHRSSGGEHRSSSHSGGEHRSGSHSGGEQHSKGGGGEGGGDDLKSREYKDADGNIHHHTRTYQEQHKNEK